MVTGPVWSDVRAAALVLPAVSGLCALAVMIEPIAMKKPNMPIVLDFI
jgi:hypothetical protein